MAADVITAPSALPPFYRRRGFWRNALPVLAMVVVFLVPVALYNAFAGGGGKRIILKKLPPAQKTVTYSASEIKNMHALVKQFVMTAVARKHLAQSYRLVGPDLREGISLKHWEAGNLPVVPFPVSSKTWIAWKKPDWSYAKSVGYQIQVITPNRPTQIARTNGVNTFFVDLKKVKSDGHSHWLVDNWVPRWTPKIPNNGG